jgi:hypothetical protein
MLRTEQRSQEERSGVDCPRQCRKLDRRTSRTRNEVLPRRSAVCPPVVELVKEHATRLVGERAMLTLAVRVTSHFA